MTVLKGKKIIYALQEKWADRTMLAHFLVTFAMLTVISAIVIKFDAGAFVNPTIYIIVGLLHYLVFYRRVKAEDVAMFLNKTIPEAEESAALLLKPFEDLNFFEKLQVQKLEHILNGHIKLPKAILRKMLVSAAMLVLSLLACIFIFILPINPTAHLSKTGKVADKTTAVKTEAKLPQIAAAEISITPPSYTGKRSKHQPQFNIVAEEGAGLSWNLTTTIAVKEVRLLFSDKSVTILKAINNTNTKWSASKQVYNPGFYQVKADTTLSELYKIEIIKDRSPDIVVRTPKPNTVIEPGRQPLTQLSLMASDDYGIKNMFVSTTVASGSGEAVSFKEQRLPFANFVGGKTQYQLQKQINLSSLGMKAGDELYFYVSATDNHNQEKRSDIFILRIEDTAQLMSIEGMASGIDIKPDFFRSQRQIIIETEQLLKSRDTISAEEFKSRSNELGVDQKLLRLRYGKFLGEETDVEIGEGHDHDEGGHTEREEFGNTEKIMDQYMHKHDNAEDATFFDAQTKKQLKATLTEMWKAELQLRTLKPKDALPFEYKALRLLKDLQQQTRAYVAKTGIKTTLLKPEKRLTGDLSQIVQPVSQQTFQPKPGNAKILRKALGILEEVRSKEPLQKPARELLEQAGIELSKSAASEPSRYLSSLEALQRILRNDHQPKDINLAGSGLQTMLSSNENIPYQSTANPDMKLSQRYFRHLNKRND